MCGLLNVLLYFITISCSQLVELKNFVVVVMKLYYILMSCVNKHLEFLLDKISGFLLFVSDQQASICIVVVKVLFN